MCQEDHDRLLTTAAAGLGPYSAEIEESGPVHPVFPLQPAQVTLQWPDANRVFSLLCPRALGVVCVLAQIDAAVPEIHRALRTSVVTDE